MTARHELTYILPIKHNDPSGEEEIGGYLAWLAPLVELIVVDASEDEAFERHARAWASTLHLKPDPRLRTTNGKVWGVLTGLARAGNDKVIVADDDVRYEAPTLERMARLLDKAEVVRPQNYFSPAPWHARWDSARILLNRVFGGDWPGTLGVRRSFLAQGYEGNCLFENLEMVRTIEAAGGRALLAQNLYVARRPPTTAHFISQRVRQAYDEWARPWRLVTQLAILPLTTLLLRRKPVLLPFLAAGSIALAEMGRWRSGGRAYFGPSMSFMAPAWLIERGACVWLAVGARLLRGGIQYHGTVIANPATPASVLRRRLLAGGDAIRGDLR